MHPQPTAIELLARQHRTDRLAAAARPRPVRRPAPRPAARLAARTAVASLRPRLERALRPAGPAADPCCA